MARDHYDRDRKHRKHSKKTKSKSKHKERRLPGDAAPIDQEDFFLRAKEFRVWLVQEKGKYVDDLSTEEATALFEDSFARKWNKGKLPDMFYKGIPESVLEQTKRTRHRWGFVSKLGEKEKLELQTAKDSVDVATKKQNLLNPNGDVAQLKETKRDLDRAGSRRRDRDDEGERDDRKRRKVERKREREYRDTVMEELAPKATGREAQIEKRRQLGERLHGAARDREDARDGLDVSDDFLMGGKKDDFQRRLAQRDSARRRRQEEQQEKLAGLAAKESARMEKFLEDMGLAGANANGGKPMTIAPRR